MKNKKSTLSPAPTVLTVQKPYLLVTTRTTVTVGQLHNGIEHDELRAMVEEFSRLCSADVLPAYVTARFVDKNICFIVDAPGYFDEVSFNETEQD